LAADSEEFFETRVRPLLVDNCYSCHTQSKLGDLRVDSREALLEGGKNGAAIMPGDPGKSLLIHAVMQTGELKMPMGGKLKENEIADLKLWIAAGAIWPKSTPTIASPKENEFQVTDRQRDFWSLRPFAKAAPPEVKDKRTVNYIDRFLLARLKEEGLDMAAPADKRTLIRRAKLDLLGLPPTPEEVDAFVNDKSADAYEKLIDGYLKSPHYGERWGRYWLDVAHFGEDDTRGLAKNRKGHEDYPKAYLYRDWVIKAFNDDMPFDQFVKAQLAADLLKKEKFEKSPSGVYDEDQMWGRLQLAKWDGLEKEERRPLLPYGHIVDESLDDGMLPALGFLGQGPWYYDLGDAKQMRADERHDRVDVVTRGFLGLTVGCARCHDHKYDPISANDYYALAGVFYNSPYHEYPLVDQSVVNAWRAKNESVEAQNKRIKEFMEAESEQLSRILAYQVKDYMMGAWKVSGEPQMKVDQAAAEGKLDVETLERWIAFLAKPPRHYPYLREWQQMIQYKGGDEFTAECLADRFQEKLLAVMIEAEEIEKRNEKIITKAWPLDDKPPIPMPNEFNTSFEKYHIVLESMDRSRINLYTDAFKYDLDAPKEADFTSKTPGVMKFKDWGVERRMSPLAEKHLEKLRADLKKLEDWRGEQYPFVMGVRDSDIITELPLHKRGSPTNLGEPVARRFLTVLCDSTDGPMPFTKGSGRLELAEAIAKHPLAARVLVNRVWKWHFGAGIVNTPSNFGQVGERPSHPELLEFLAQRFADGGMSIKQLHRDIMLSAAYRLSSDYNEAAYKKDPNNRLHWRFSRRRLDAETIRDSLLFVSGLLKDKVGGPSGDLDDPKFNRRTVYGTVSRFLLADYLRTFDFPNPSLTAEQRFSTSVPQQPLFFMNSEFVYLQAAALAERVAKPAGDTPAKPAGDTPEKNGKPAKDDKTAKVPEPTPRERITKAYRLLYGRAPTAEELAAGLDFLSDDRNKKRQDDFKDIPVTAWNQYARVLLSSNEFIYLN
jgi:hypothetical protein